MIFFSIYFTKIELIEFVLYLYFYIYDIINALNTRFNDFTHKLFTDCP